MRSGVAPLASLVAIVSALAATGVAAADAAGPSVRGPASVVVARMVTFRARGLAAGSTVNVVLSPADRDGCCGIRVKTTYFVSSTGSATLTFRVPPHYLDCRRRPHCRKVRWAEGEPATVTLVGYLVNASTTTVIRRPPRA